jgi:putative DNA primase/helicase
VVNANGNGRPLADAALAYAARGWRVIPLHHVAEGGCSCGKADCGSPGKHPLTRNGLRDGTADEATIRGWWREWPLANVGVCTGPESGIWMLGPDAPNGVGALADLERENAPLPPTPQERSGSGGRHLLFRWPADGTVTNRKNHLGVPIDIRGAGGYFVAAPSANGRGPYVWEVPPEDVEPPEAPPWLLAWVRDDGKARQAPPPRGKRAGGPDVRGRAVAYLAKCPPAVSGQGGHNTTMSAARAVVYGFDFGPDAGFNVLWQEYNPRCQPPWSERELRHKAEQADAVPYDKPRGWLLDQERGSPHRSGHAGPSPDTAGGVPPAEIHLTDLGNARRVVARHGGDLRYNHPWKSWLCWDGRRWAVDDTAEVVRRVKETQGALFREVVAQIRELGDAAAGEDNEERKAKLAALRPLLAHALKWEERKRVDDCLKLMQSEPGIPVVAAQLDRDPFLFNVKNGELDLRTGGLRPHRREDLITKLAPVDYDPDAPCPRWLAFLDRIMDGNADLTGYLRRVVGYCLTGDVREQCLWFFHGGGANGKSTFLGTLLALLGDYGMQAVSDLLMAKTNESHPTERADLFGRRLAATVETEEGKRIAEALMKQLTGGDRVRARRMRQDFFEFDATHKIILAANHKPQVRGTDLAVWRRIKLVPFTVTIPDEEKDPALPAALRAELPGVLAWAVGGCLAWQRDGLGEPDEVRAATAEYQQEQDTVAGFLSACCYLDSGVRVQAGILYERFLAWSGEKGLSQKAFNDVLRKKGYAGDVGAGNRFFWHGIGVPAISPD